MAKPKSAEPLAHCCAIFLWSLGREIDDHHRNPNINDSDHLVGRLTTEPSASVLTSAVSLTL